MRLRTSLPLLTVLLVSACTDEPGLMSPGFEPVQTSASLNDGCALGVSDVVALAQIDAVLESLHELAGTESLNAGQMRALTNHLETARTHVAEHRYCPARAQLDAFRIQVQQHRANDRLTDRQLSALLQRLRLLNPATPLPNEPRETYAPGVMGELRSVQVGEDEIVFEVIDGLAIFQSDVILGYADEVEASLRGVGVAAPTVAAPAGDLGTMSGACTFLLGICERWTDQTIGYDYLNDWGDEDTNRMMRNRINAAIAHWEARTGMRFERRSGGERLVFGNSGGCSSWIGRRSVTGLEPQYINLNTECDYGAVIHEIGHAVGLHHEHNRWDRDSNVGIERSIIIFEKLHNFSHYLILGQDVGPYDYGSIMHYDCTAFRTAGSTGNTIEPTRPGFGCADTEQRDSLSEGDVLGAYALYAPEFTITGAADGETGDRFDLGMAFTTKPVQDHYITWSRRGGTDRLATGPNATIRAADVPPGTHVITARITVNMTTVARRSITLTFHNEAPAVDLGPDRTVDLNREFVVSTSTTDAEDGACPLTVCSYAWDPAPAQDMGTAARYRFVTEGPMTISATVTDGGGATGTDDITVTVVNSPPQTTIEVPSSGSSMSSGTAIQLSGYAMDANEGPGPGPGRLNCAALVWSSSDPTDRFSPDDIGCRPWLTFGDPGPRTITLTATDPQGLARSSSVPVDVVGCGANCPPTASFILRTTPELDGSTYTHPFTGPGYYLSTPIEMAGLITDADGPSDNPVTYEWRMRPACLGPGGSCPTIVLESGTVDVAESVYGGGRVSIDFTWTPQDDVTPWSGCVTTALEHTIQLWVRDARGETNIATRTVHLACSLI